ncbi:MAG TPA: FAD-dependent oxidoreductase [Gaiellaceae bacterium]|nr:FAD-dependent oxidoreductase [Gaiellaceae bacterium]
MAIVGAGVTGCSCALTLADAGLRVRVHDAREVAGGASGRNGGFALRGAAPAYDVARIAFGAERAASLWRLTERALERLAGLAGDAFRRTGSLRLASEPEEAASIRAEYEALLADGFDVEWRPELDGRLAGRFHGAIFHPLDGSIHPARWVRRLAACAAEAGAEIREHEPVQRLEQLDADQVVLATDGYTHGLVEELDVAVKPVRGQVIATEPLETEDFPCPHYARHGYVYWQQTTDLRLVLGGFRDTAFEEESTAVERPTPGIQRRLDEYAAELVGRPPRVTNRWSGIFGVTEDRLPLTGPVPGRSGLWAACGYSGHGNVLGLACGELVALGILGQAPPELQLFDPARLLKGRPGPAERAADPRLSR